jgi:hypothetical protein
VNLQAGRLLLVGNEVVEGFDLVVFGGLGVDADVVEAGVAEEFGDRDQVGADADE